MLAVMLTGMVVVGVMIWRP